ncbi:MAG: hypothetical protein IPL83_06860 [Bdellovibrionales bacterium]|nr:hypothetical protein [Bdellovibrionales bacterium]
MAARAQPLSFSSCLRLLNGPVQNKIARLIYVQRSSAIIKQFSTIFPIPPFRVLVIRGTNHPTEIQIERYLSADHIGTATKWPLNPSVSAKERALKNLYQSFSLQGPERTTLLPRILEQDSTESERIIHFLVHYYSISDLREYVLAAIDPERLIDKAQPLLHLQVLLSSNKSEPLHVEDEIGPIERSPGEVIAEAGRLSLSKNSNDSLVTGHDIKFMELYLYRQLFVWLRQNNIVNRVFFQVNSPVLRALKRQGLPIDRAISRTFNKNYEVEGKINTVTEHVLELNQDLIRDWHRIVSARQLDQIITLFLSSGEDPKLLKILLTPPEVEPLIDLGLVALTSKEQSTSWKIPNDSPHSLAAIEMRTLPRNYRHVDVNSEEFRELERMRDPVWIFYAFENAFGGLQKMRMEEPPSEGTIFNLDEVQFSQAKYVSFFIPIDVAHEILRRLRSSPN